MVMLIVSSMVISQMICTITVMLSMITVCILMNNHSRARMIMRENA